MTILWIETLERLVALVEEKLLAAHLATGDYSHADYDGWRKRSSAAEAELIAFFTDEEGARFNSSAERSVRMAGIQASSTTGTIGALQNWRTAARKKLAAEDGFNPHGSGPVPIERKEA